MSLNPNEELSKISSTIFTIAIIVAVFCIVWAMSITPDPTNPERAEQLRMYRKELDEYNRGLRTYPPKRP